MMKWFRRDTARKAGQATPSRAFSLGGIVAITALLALATALVAVPLRRTRERQMIAAAREQAHAIFEALEAYRGANYRFPDAIGELRSVGYSMPPSIVVCRFHHVHDARSFDDHVQLAVHHRASERALTGRYPSRGAMMEQSVTEACSGERSEP